MVSNQRLERKAAQSKPGQSVPGPTKSPDRRASEWEVREREWD